MFKVIDASYRSGVPGQVVRKAEPSKSRRLRVIKVLVPLFKYLRDERRLVTGEALAGVPVAKKNGDKTTRDRVLSDVELRSVWLKAESLHPSYRDIVRLLILTGQRLSDVAGMRRSEIEGDVWTIPAERYKSKRDQTVFLPVTALSLVAGATSTEDLLFPGRRGTPISGWSKLKARLDGLVGFDDWVLHDIRRTVATGLQGLGFQREVTEKVLGHAPEGANSSLVKIYQRHEFADEKRLALAAWASRVEEIQSERAKRSNVTRLKRTGGGVKARTVEQ